MHGSDDTTSVVDLRTLMLIALRLSGEVYTGKNRSEQYHAIEIEGREEAAFGS